MEYEKVNWETAEKVQNAYIKIGTQNYNVVDAEYECDTPLNVENLNNMDSGIDNMINSLNNGNINHELWSGVWKGDDNTDEIELEFTNFDDEVQTGLVFIYSAFASNQAQNYAWNIKFIPKKNISIANPTEPNYFLMPNYIEHILIASKFGRFGAKALKIRGVNKNDKDYVTIRPSSSYEKNFQKFTAGSGIYVENDMFVLRHIIAI